MHPNNLANEYVDELPDDFYERTPKAVFAAVAIEALTSSGRTTICESPRLIIRTWRRLHASGVIPQSVPQSFMDFVKD